MCTEGHKTSKVSISVKVATSPGWNKSKDINARMFTRAVSMPLCLHRLVYKCMCLAVVRVGVSEATQAQVVAEA